MQEKAPTYIPENRMAWWGELDLRERCTVDDKVVIESQALAMKKAERIQERGEPMVAYLGKCGHWHVGHTNKKSIIQRVKGT